MIRIVAWIAVAASWLRANLRWTWIICIYSHKVLSKWINCISHPDHRLPYRITSVSVRPNCARYDQSISQSMYHHPYFFRWILHISFGLNWAYSPTRIQPPPVMMSINHTIVAVANSLLICLFFPISLVCGCQIYCLASHAKHMSFISYSGRFLSCPVFAILSVYCWCC